MEAEGEAQDEYSYKPTRVSLTATLRTDVEWSSLQLCKPLLRGLRQMDYLCPTPIQRDVIPDALSGVDILAQSQTGSGKTAAYLIPCLNRLALSPTVRRRKLMPSSGQERVILNLGQCVTKVLVLLPTRELAAQCFGVCVELAAFLPITYCLLSGGSSLESQERKIRALPDVLMCTPGRCLDVLLNTPTFHLELLDIFVLDEADKLVELGFKDVCVNIASRCSPHRQTMLFSATLCTGDLISFCLKRPKVFTDQGQVETPLKLAKLPQSVSFDFISIPKADSRIPALRKVLEDRRAEHPENERIIIFFNSRKSVRAAATLLRSTDLCSVVVEMHGNLSHAERVNALRDFQEQDDAVLVATDLMARGIDVEGVTLVINAEVPQDAEARTKGTFSGNMSSTLTKFVHRSGRTGRGGQTGLIKSFFVKGAEDLLRKHYTRFLATQKNVLRAFDYSAEDVAPFVIAGAKRMVKTQLMADQADRDLRTAEAKLQHMTATCDADGALPETKTRREWIHQHKVGLDRRVRKDIKRNMAASLAAKKRAAQEESAKKAPVTKRGAGSKQRRK